MPLRREVSLKTNTIILLVMFAFGGFFLLIQMPSGGANGVAAATTRGGRMFVIRPPEVAQSTLPRQITIFENYEGLSDTSRAVFYELNNSSGEAETKSIQLSLEQWNAIAELQDTWCKLIPKNRIHEQSSLFYDIGMRCRGPFGISARQIKLRGDELPIELQQIIVVPK
jgi:hypothetical protein